LLATLMSASPALAEERTAPGPDSVVLVGAGDIADCKAIEGAEATARLLDAIPGTVFTLGDHAYPKGTARQFADCYDPTWGRHRARTRPTPGNHDYKTPGAAPYFAYFGAAAGEADKGYYSYELGSWHVVVLNSNCDEVGGCEAGSEQERWLRADLAAQRTDCTVAYWHHPRYSSGSHGGEPEMAALWQALYEAGVELGISGHDHVYERFAPQDGAGQLDREHGTRQIVAGTGGKKTSRFAETEPNSEARATGVFGVLKLTLSPGRYAWEFVPIAGESFRDSGEGSCRRGRDEAREPEKPARPASAEKRVVSEEGER
jgi:3',5'-cyclic AMP phosphodiesterase CpdA